MRRMGWMGPMPGLLLVMGCGGEAASTAIRNDVGNTASLPASPVATTPDTSSSPQSDPKALPVAVVAFRDRRDQCDHFRGEEPGDEARAAELEKLLEKTCRGTDAELAELRRRYRGNAAVIAALRGYENQVE